MSNQYTYQDVEEINKEAGRAKYSVYLGLATQLEELLPDRPDYNPINLTVDDKSVTINPSSERVIYGGQITFQPTHTIQIKITRTASVKLHLCKNNDGSMDIPVYYINNGYGRPKIELLQNLIKNSCLESSQKKTLLTPDEYILPLVTKVLSGLIKVRSQQLQENIDTVQTDTVNAINMALSEGSNLTLATGFVPGEKHQATEEELESANEKIKELAMQVETLSKIELVGKKKTIMAYIGSVLLIYQLAEIIYKVNPEFFQALFKKANLVNPVFLTRLIESLDQYLN